MTFPAIVRSDAQRDIAEIALWYERQQPGIGNYFLLCVDAAMESAKRAPMVYPKFYGEYRRILVRKFPVGLFYLLHRDRIVVAAALDLRRNPLFIKERLK